MKIKTLLLASMLCGVFSGAAEAMNGDELFGAAGKYKGYETNVSCSSADTINGNEAIIEGQMTLSSIEELFNAGWKPMRFDFYSIPPRGANTSGGFILYVESQKISNGEPCSRRDFFPNYCGFFLGVNEDFLCGLSSLLEVVLPMTVTRIGDYAFANTALQQLTIPLSVKKIGEHILENCQNINFVVIPDELVRTYKGGGDIAKRLCVPLNKLIFMTKELPAVIDEISAGDGKLYNENKIYSSRLASEDRSCMGLPKGLVLSQNQNGNYDITELEDDWIELQNGDEAFDIRNKKTVLNKDIANITKGNDFMNVSPIDTLTPTLKKIGKRAFKNTIIQQLTIPFGMSDIGEDAFKDCKFLEQLAVSSGLIKKYGGIDAFAAKVGVSPDVIVVMSKVSSYEIEKFQKSAILQDFLSKLMK